MQIESLLLTAKTHLQGLFAKFPICIALLSAILFTGSANIAHLFLAASLIVIAPLIVLALGLLGPSLSPTYWMTATTFIFTYLFQNAYALYNKEAPANAPPSKVAARKSQAVMAMISTTAMAALFIVLRMISSPPQETIGGALVGLGAGVGVAVGIYNFMVSCGGLRIADVFGIAGRMDFKAADGTICYPVK